MDAKEAPKAFSVEKTVSPAMWLIHYKGQAVPPETGRFRFIGYADDWLAVAVNGKIALVAARQDVKLIQTRWESPEKAGMRAGNGNLKVGDWIDFKKGIPFDSDIVIGERPGGKFGGFLMIQKEGGVYEMTPDGQFPILPIFQVAPRKVKATKTNAGPPFSENASVWTALP